MSLETIPVNKYSIYINRAELAHTKKYIIDTFARLNIGNIDEADIKFIEKINDKKQKYNGAIIDITLKEPFVGRTTEMLEKFKNGEQYQLHHNPKYFWNIMKFMRKNYNECIPLPANHVYPTTTDTSLSDFTYKSTEVPTVYASYCEEKDKCSIENIAKMIENIKKTMNELKTTTSKTRQCLIKYDLDELIAESNEILNESGYDSTLPLSSCNTSIKKYTGILPSISDYVEIIYNLKEFVIEAKHMM